MSIYALKPRFQALLRPLVAWLYDRRVTANQVTLTTCLISIAVGGSLYWSGGPPPGFIAIPVWMLLRMALNAVDGMLAREFGQQSKLGAYLNEVTDVVSDAALYLPFATVAPFTSGWVSLVIFLSVLSEFVGIQGLTLGASRRYDGPMGKSDRAFVFGVLGLWLGLAPLPGWLYWLLPVLAVSIGWTIVNRIRSGLEEATRP